METGAKKFSIAVLISLIACSSISKYNYSNYKKISEPPKKTKLLSQVMVRKSDINLLMDFEVMGDYAIVVDKKSDKMIKIFSIKTHRLKTSFGRKGQGPAEFIQPIIVTLDPENKWKFWIYDLSLKELKKFDLRKILRGNFYPERTVEFKKGTPVYLAITAEGKILATGIFRKGRIWMYDIEGNVEKIIGKIPVKFKNKLLAPQHSQGFLGKLVYEPDKKEIFVVTEFGSIIERYNAETGELIIAYIGPGNFFPEYDITRAGPYYVLVYNKKTRIGYIDIKLNRKLKKIILLYSGKRFFDNKGRPVNESSNKILIMDSNGKIEEEYLLDKEIGHISLSEKEFRIYGATTEEIFRFERQR